MVCSLRNMKVLRSPDFIITLMLTATLSALILYLGWPMKDALGWRVFLLTAIPVIHAGLSLCWVASRHVRMHTYRLYYLAFGPRCDAEVLGTIHVDSSLENGAVLNTALSVAKDWRADARETVRITNRSVIQAGPRTLTITVTPISVFSEVNQEEKRDDRRRNSSWSRGCN